MSLEGNLRDLQLQEVLQLLAHGRKSGQLRLSAQLAGLTAVVRFDRGSIVDAIISAAPIAFDSLTHGSHTRAQVQGAVLELLTWHDGSFQFVPAAADADWSGTIRIATEMLLVEGAGRIEAWAQLADRIPHTRVVPAFVAAEPTQLPLLHLSPQQWEVLTQVDGQRDLTLLANALGRDLLHVAQIVYALIGTGLLTVATTARTARTFITPPNSSPSVIDVAAPHPDAADIWVPTPGDAQHPHGHDDETLDAIFDPVRVGVITPEGLPRLRTPLFASVIDEHALSAVQLVEVGNVAARRGNLSEAIATWALVLQTGGGGRAADHAREAIALSSRLIELLSSTAANELR